MSLNLYEMLSRSILFILWKYGYLKNYPWYKQCAFPCLDCLDNKVTNENKIWILLSGFDFCPENNTRHLKSNIMLSNIYAMDLILEWE